MAEPFPHQYKVDLKWVEGQKSVLESPPRPSIFGGAPPQFDGQDTWWSPEGLLLASASLCLTTTFFAIAAKSKLNVSGFSCHTEGTLDKTDRGPVFTQIDFHTTINVSADDATKAEKLIQSAKRHCIISNSLNVPFLLHSKVVS